METKCNTNICYNTTIDSSNKWCSVSVSNCDPCRKMAPLNIMFYVVNAELYFTVYIFNGTVFSECPLMGIMYINGSVAWLAVQTINTEW
jgi:hypothetical protein